jgi:hypothetical protein
MTICTRCDYPARCDGGTLTCRTCGGAVSCGGCEGCSEVRRWDADSIGAVFRNERTGITVIVSRDEWMTDPGRAEGYARRELKRAVRFQDGIRRARDVLEMRLDGWVRHVSDAVARDMPPMMYRFKEGEGLGECYVLKSERDEWHCIAHMATKNMLEMAQHIARRCACIPGVKWSRHHCPVHQDALPTRPSSPGSLPEFTDPDCENVPVPREREPEDEDEPPEPISTAEDGT